MALSTEQKLAVAFQVAIATACSESGVPTVPPVSSSPPATATATSSPPKEVATSARAPDAIAASTVENISPKSLEYGQRCMGSVLQGLKPAQPFDGVELRLEYFMPTHRVIRAGASGELCSRASQRAACLEAVEKVRPEKGGEWLVFTRGDLVSVMAGAEVKKQLVPIETPEEAAMAMVYEMATNVSGAAILPSCDPTLYRPTANGFEMLHVTTSFCGQSTRTTYRIATDGSVSQSQPEVTPPIQNCPQPHLGRRTEGVRAPLREGDDVGAYLLWCAEIEDASVPAFERLERELHLHRAPKALCLRARAALRDEERHTREMASHARRWGRSFHEQRKPLLACRSLREMAIENMVEGCVFEAFAALTAVWQASHAEDRELRFSLSVIARDETRHAALALDVARWLAPILSDGDRRAVEAAKQEAFARLREECAVDADSTIARYTGLPPSSVASALCRALETIVSTQIAA
ncbi:MAG: hypothetical protein U0165_13955 [Polyangiaceae bacterium]